jgi:hypothetical protein
MTHPDPIVTASIYCNQRLDAVVGGVVAPWTERLRELDPAGGWKVWWMRYSRNGEHLKVRLHGPAEHRESAERMLAEAADAFFAGLPAAEPDEERRSRPRAPAVDPEDETAEMQPDRTLAWTRYRRSPVSLGPLFLDDDEFVARITACFAAGAALILDAQQGVAAEMPEGVRQQTVIRAIVAGLGGATLSPEERALYLAYHRDWLLRTIAADDTHEAKLRALFERRLAGMQPLVRQLRDVTATHWDPAHPHDEAGAEGRLRTGVEALRAYVAPFRLDPERWGDPFAHDASFPLVFKTLQGIANQAGVDMVTEALLHHVLLAVATGAPAPRLAETV